MSQGTLLAFIGCCLLSVAAHAQTTTDTPLPDVPPPKLPIVAAPADRSAWTIQITPAGSAKGPPGDSQDPHLPLKYLKEQDWTKTGQLMRCIDTWTDGSTTQDWVYKHVKFYQGPQGDGIHLFDPKLDPRYHNFEVSAFERLDWLTLQNYVGAVKHAGQVCYLFRTKGAPAAKGTGTDPHNKSMEDLNVPTTPSSAYVSVDTHLPVTLVTGDGTFDYRFGPASTDTLVMPEPYLSVWKAYVRH